MTVTGGFFRTAVPFYVWYLTSCSPVVSPIFILMVIIYSHIQKNQMHPLRLLVSVVVTDRVFPSRPSRYFVYLRQLFSLRVVQHVPFAETLAHFPTMRL
ncbi:hypothetical protein BDR04DRAFT_87712 [Suillus decipiens]|nr:hypothetical protein BDR04DRAFT_87712 [Suillus decipiens]